MIAPAFLDNFERGRFFFPGISCYTEPITKLIKTDMAKRVSGLKRQKSHSHKTKKRLEAKRVMLEEKAKKRKNHK
jgi:hypothetical protein